MRIQKETTGVIGDATDTKAFCMSKSCLAGLTSSVSMLWNALVIDDTPRQRLPKCYSHLRKSVYGSQSGLEHCMLFKSLFVLGKRRW